MTIAAQNAQLRYQSFKDSLTVVARNSYYAKCMRGVETFAAVYTDQLYHYTLYFYDQANNLVKTIPPHGFNNALFAGTTASNTQLTNIRKYRANNHYPKIPGNNNSTPAHYPVHSIPTYYQYNSLNQVTYQWSTDGGGTRMVYDEMRRLVRSHNANQKKKKFSYTKYDYLNRVAEVGECAYTTDQDTLSTSTTYATHTILVAGGVRSQITRTRYDYTYEASVNGYFGVAGQENLRGRIATVMYAPSNGTSPNGVPTFEQATHYTYDIHGNVKMLIQDHSTFGLKRIYYDYELVSGNVKSVTYQKGRWDQFIHYYAYDNNNRLKWVQTSQFPTAITAPNSGTREQEAQYFYYLHGPLRRVELGSLKVQGIDYAYTLQGWIKGVNGGELKHQYNDIGQDGRPGTTNAPVARDAFGYVLGYYSNSTNGQNDYHPSNSAAPVFDRDGYTVGTAAALYNGNIAKMTTATRDNDNTTTPGIRSQRMQYRYDQLQRIKKQDAFDWNGTTYASTTAYAMTLTYDAGGNIKTMARNGDATLLNMDNLSYVYGNAAKPNRLTQITDTHTTASFADDLETQSANNYTYDNIGNMTGDLSEGGKTVSWNVYNKITNVSMSSGTKTLAFGYDAAGNRVRKESMSGGTTTKQWYVRDAQGNIMSTYKQVGTGTLKQEYVYLYGSTRTGEYLLNRDSATAWNRHYYRVKGNRHYELTNHLGNVLAVVTDRKIAKDTTADLIYTPQFFMPDVYSVQNYYAFGQSMPKWSGTAAVNDPKKYRFGMNGQERDTEFPGGNTYYAEFWEYDARSGRRFNLDPRPNMGVSHYAAFGDNPIVYSDFFGDTLRAVNATSGQRALEIVKGTFTGMGLFGQEMASLFKLAKDGLTFETISEKDYNSATAKLTEDEKALAKGYYDAINSENTNTVEIVKRGEKLGEISKHALKSLSFTGPTANDVERDNGGGFCGSNNYDGVTVRSGKTGAHAIIVMNSKSTLDSYSDGISRPSLAGELMEHELLGHGLSGQILFTDGQNEAVQAGNLYLRTNKFNYFRKDHGVIPLNPSDRNSNPNDIPSYLIDKQFSSFKKIINE